MTDDFHVLGLTNMRVDEMRDPFERLGRRATLLTVDPDDGLRGYLSAVSTGARCIERRESDAVVVYNGSGLIGVVGALLGRYYDVPLLIRQNGDIFRQHREKVVDLLEEREWRTLATFLPFALLTRVLFGRADGFVPVTSALTGTIHRQTHCPTGRIVPAPNPVRFDHYSPPEREVERSGDEGQTLLTVTNLYFRGKYEGVTELVDGVVPVLRRRPEVEYVVAGDGRYYERLNRYLEANVGEDVRDRIRTPGFVEDVAPLYWDADVFLYASYIDGYPNVILEAQAAGLPIVTNPAYGIGEQVEDGESGIFVEPSDPVELERTVSRLLDDPAERRRLGRNGSDRVRVENDPDVVASKIYDAVETIVTGGKDRDRRGDAPPTTDATVGGQGEQRERLDTSRSDANER